MDQDGGIIPASAGAFPSIEVRKKAMTPSDTATLLHLAQALSPLEPWVPVGLKIACIHETLTGDGGLTMGDVELLKRWAEQWGRMRVELQEFYARLAPTNTAASIVLHAYLCDARCPSGFYFVELRSLWLDEYGTDCPWDLFPGRKR